MKHIDKSQIYWIK